MQLGVIADDFTGATDIASFLVRNGMPTVQLNGVPPHELPLTSEAVVISLKTHNPLWPRTGCIFFFFFGNWRKLCKSEESQISTCEKK